MWWTKRRNWLGETRDEELERRLTAVEEHMNNLEMRYTAHVFNFDKHRTTPVGNTHPDIFESAPEDDESGRSPENN